MGRIIDTPAEIDIQKISPYSKTSRKRFFINTNDQVIVHFIPHLDFIYQYDSNKDCKIKEIQMRAGKSL